MITSIKLAQALNAKLCHDFAGSIGSIDNCASLINSVNNLTKEKSIELIQASSNKLINYLKFYRHLYSISHDNDEISIEEIKILSDKFLGSRNYHIKLEFSTVLFTNINTNISKVIMGLVILSADNLMKEGTIKIEIKINDSSYNIKVIASGKKIKPGGSLSDIISGKNPIDDLNTHNANEYYIYYLAKELGYTLYINQSANMIEYRCVADGDHKY